MTTPARNPYAPPAAVGADSPEVVSLPPGVRRYSIDPALYRAAVRGQLIRSVGRYGLFVLLCYPAWWTVTRVMFGIWIPLAFYLFLWAIASTILIVRVRRLNRRALPTYDLLVGPRAIRRTLAGMPPAEILRPEVRRAYETRRGLWLESDVPPCTLVVSRTLADYTELRTTLSAWCPIERVSGWKAWRRARGTTWRQRPRDVVAGTALQADESLALELEGLRRASSTAWTAHPQIARPTMGRLVKRVLLVWGVLVVLMVVLLAIWQILEPGRRHRRPLDRATPGAHPGTLGP